MQKRQTFRSRLIPVITSLARLPHGTGLAFSLCLQPALPTLLIMFFPGATLHPQTGFNTGAVVGPSGTTTPRARIQVIDRATGDLTREPTADIRCSLLSLNVLAATYKIKVTSAGIEGA